jgi:putative membrane protein insertion efficiency factor
MPVKLLYTFIFCAIQIFSYAQEKNFDLQLIAAKNTITETDFSYYKRKGNDSKVIKNANRSFLSKINPVTNSLKAAMLLYQNVISPQLSKSCAYHTTCSNFSKQAISKFGIVKGVFLTADRLMRCNRIAVLDVNTLYVDEATGTIIDSLNLY